MVKNKLPFAGTLPFLNVVGAIPDQRILRKRREGVVSLISEDVAVSKKKDTRLCRSGSRLRFTSGCRNSFQAI